MLEYFCFNVPSKYKVSQKKVFRDTGLDSKPIHSIHVNIMVPGVTVNFILGHPVPNFLSELLIHGGRREGERA